MAEGGNEFFGVREPCNTAGEILPVPPLIKEGTQKPPFVKGAARSAGGFGNVAVMKRTFQQYRLAPALQEKEAKVMATFTVDAVEIFGKGVMKAEGVVIDKAGNAWGGGRNGTVYKVSPEGKVQEVAQLPSGSIPNGVTLDRAGNFVYCDLGKKAMMRLSPDGKVSMIADRVGTVT